MIPADYYGFQQGVDEERLDEEEGREEGEEGGNDYNKVLNASTGFYYDELLKNQEGKKIYPYFSLLDLPFSLLSSHISSPSPFPLL